MPNWHLVGKMWQIAKLVHLSAICLYGRNDRDPAIGPFSAYFVVKPPRRICRAERADGMKGIWYN